MNEQLIRRVKHCPSLPSLPTIAVQVLDLAQKPEVDIAEIARIISRDPALAGKILRTVNSSFYGRSQAVGTISQALVILGLQSVKALVLGFSLVTNLSAAKPRGFKHVVYWKRSIHAATAARVIANKIKLVQQEEAFLAALLMDIGMLALDQVLGDEYGEICGNVPDHYDLPDIERDALKLTHADIGGIIAEQWKLPPVLTVPLAQHHTPEAATDPTLRKLAELISLSGRCADVFIDDRAAPAIADVRRLCYEHYQFSEADCDALLAEIGQRTREVASLFELNIGSSREYGTILKKANDALVDVTLRNQRPVTALARQNVQVSENATIDALTGLADRARLDSFIAEAFASSLRAGKPMAVLLIEVDGFKSITDRHGPPAGDAVLRHVARLLKAAARPQDLAARHGMAELALVLPGAPRPQASVIAQTIRRAIAAKPLVHALTTIPLTVSIGVACFEATSPFTHIGQLTKAAGMALHNARHCGRNCVRVFSLKPGGKSSPQAGSAAA